MKKNSPHEDLIQELKDPAFAIGYLNECLKDGDDGVFLLGLKYVAEAHGGIGLLAKNSEINREHLYRLLSKKGNPSLVSLQAILKSFGWTIQIVVQPTIKLKKAA